jgi:lactoylglutathione lyase
MLGEVAAFRPAPVRFSHFLDPRDNRIEVVEYRNVQFTKAPEVLKGMKFSHLEKSAEAMQQLAHKGIM